MGSVPFPPSTMRLETIPSFLILTHKARKVQTSKWKRELNTFLHVQIANNTSLHPSGTQLIHAKCKDNSAGGTSSDEDADDLRALDVVLRLYLAIKNRDLEQLSDVIGEECRCMSNFVLAFKPFHGKQQVLEFFRALMGAMGNHVEFVIQPTMDDGTNVGLQWTLTCSKTHAPLGKGFSFYTAHSYKGKLVIRNAEMFMEPMLHIEPLRLKLIGVLSKAIAHLGAGSLYKKKMKGYLLLLSSLLLVAVSLVLVKL